MLKWVFERLEDGTTAVDTPIGRLPAPGALDVGGLDIDDRDLGWREAVPQIRDHFARFGERLPRALAASLDRLDAALS